MGLRTGDASARDKRLARSGKLDVLVTTPESLALLLSYPDTALQLSALRCVIVDEWHELLGNKRGVLLQLCLARLRGWTPQLRIWGCRQRWAIYRRHAMCCCRIAPTLRWSPASNRAR